jgi:hypothetical protein
MATNLVTTRKAPVRIGLTVTYVSACPQQHPSRRKHIQMRAYSTQRIAPSHPLVLSPEFWRFRYAPA